MRIPPGEGEDREGGRGDVGGTSLIVDADELTKFVKGCRWVERTEDVEEAEEAEGDRRWSEGGDSFGNGGGGGCLGGERWGRMLLLMMMMSLLLSMMSGLREACRVREEQLRTFRDQVPRRAAEMRSRFKIACYTSK